MKRILVSLCSILLLAVIAIQVNSAPYVYDLPEITLSTSTATLVAKPLVRSIYFLAVNTGANYELMLATYPATASDTIGLTLNKGFGFWEENYTCYQSSWYAIAKTGATTIKIRRKE